MGGGSIFLFFFSLMFHACNPLSYPSLPLQTLYTGRNIGSPGEGC